MTWRWGVVAVALCAVAFADEKPAKKPPPLDTKPSVTRHKVDVGGKSLEYVATAGYVETKAEEGKANGRFFHVSYVVTGADAGTRPVTFVFNGGPGSASLWLHIGTVGPRRVTGTDVGHARVPPGRVAPNKDTWLDLTDLVFIDPVGTGYSRPAKGASQKDFSGLTEDANTVAEFIRLWTTRNGRWSSPKYLCGESYGTTRAAALAGRLQSRYGMYLNGIVFVSKVLNFQSIRFADGNDLPYVLYLPAYAATAHYHGALDKAHQERPLAEVLRDVERFAYGPYNTALTLGARMSDEERLQIARTVAEYTGLDPEFVLRSDLRIKQWNFCKELLRKTGRTVGRLDSRYKGIDKDGVGDGTDYDPSMEAIRGPYSSAIQDYFRRDLKYENDLVYESLSGRVGRWKYPEGRYVNVAGTLRDAMTRNKNLKVLVASGYYDLATPYSAADYVIGHLGLDPSLRGNVRVRYYEAGHMMYVHKPSREKLKRDVAEFFAWK